MAYDTTAVRARGDAQRITLTGQADAAREKVGDMMQALLADRFKMKLHRDTKRRITA